MSMIYKPGLVFLFSTPAALQQSPSKLHKPVHMKLYADV